jgi:sulfatase maturation enzyme AslB (radical SAM superfamily)/SAM-dependent methyltransferase
MGLTNDFTARAAAHDAIFYQDPLVTALGDGPFGEVSERGGFDWLEGEIVPVLDMTDVPLAHRLLSGFYALEDGSCRWMGTESRVLLDVPPKARFLFIEGYAHAASVGKEGLRIQARYASTIIGSFTIMEAGGFSRFLPLRVERLPLPLCRRGIITLVSSTHFVPAELDPSSGDGRALSVILKRIGFSTTKETPPKTLASTPLLPAAGVMQPPVPYLHGTCLLCGERGLFPLENPNLVRDSLACPSCGALNRWRQLARGLLRYLRCRKFNATTIPELANELPNTDVVIYDTYSMYPLSRCMERAGAHYLTSEFYAHLAPGTVVRPNHSCQDLSRLTFADASVDVVLATDVFEHVRLHREAFAEIYRVLRPGGALVFTVPFVYEYEQNDIFVRVNDPLRPDADEDLHPPTYHGDPLHGSGARVFRIYGRELFSELQASGFDVFFERTSVAHLGVYNCEVFTCLKRGGAESVDGGGATLVRRLPLTPQDEGRWNERVTDTETLATDLASIERLEQRVAENGRLSAQQREHLGNMIAVKRQELGLIEGSLRAEELFGMEDGDGSGAPIDPARYPLGQWQLEWLNLELCSACNFRCVYCNLDHRRPVQNLSMELFEKALSEIAAGRFPSLKRLDLHNGGETLLHPEIRDALRLLARYRPRFPRQLHVSLLTNGSLLDRTLAVAMCEESGLDEVRFSMDGGTPELYERIRRNGSYRTVSTNIRGLAEEIARSASGLRIGIICLVEPQRSPTVDWMDPEFRSVLALADSVEIRHPHHWDGTMNRASQARPELKRRERMCKFLFGNLVLLASGEVTVCCADLRGKGTVGELAKSTLLQIWQGEARRNMLLRWRRGDFLGMRLCEPCEGYY